MQQIRIYMHPRDKEGIDFKISHLIQTETHFFTPLVS